MITIDEIMKEVDSKASGRTRWEGQEPKWDEMMVGEIRALRESNRLLAHSAHAGNALSEYAASSREDNTPEFVEGIMEECEKVQSLFHSAEENTYASAAIEAARKGI